MALANNQRFQIAERLQADIKLRQPSWTVSLSFAVGGTATGPDAGDPMISVVNGSTALALIGISRRHYAGFNVVAELSSSAAEGLPEHIAYCLENSSNSQAVTAQLAMYVSKMACSSMKLGFVSVGNLTEANLIDTNVSVEIPNDARLGASGN